jgi:hypothetical protein
MSSDLTELARIASEKTNVRLQIAFEIDGISTVFGAIPLKKYLQYGDDVYYGDAGIVYGGFIEIADQKAYVSMQSGTTTRISQVVRQDKGDGESVTSMQIAMIDKNNELTALFQPGNIIDDLLGRRAKVWLGFEGTAFPNDYIVLFRGYIDQFLAGPGLWTINVIHSDNRRRAEVFLPVETTASSSILAGDTTISVIDASKFLIPKLGPDLTYDSSFESLIQIDDEVIKYTSKTGTSFSGLTRGYLGTTASAHDSGASVRFRAKLRGNPIDLALKLMLSSGSSTGYVEDLRASNFVRISPTELVGNSIFFNEISLSSKYNILVDDYVSTSGATNGSNNVSLKKIIDIQETDFGSYVVIDGVSFTEELATSALVTFRSQFDVWPDGLNLSNDEVDIFRHQQIRDNFLSFALMEFHLDDAINGKEFISSELFNPIACYSIPREARCSIGFHIGPLPNRNIQTLNLSTVKEASSIQLNRSTSKNFYNTVTVKYDPLVLDQEFSQKGFIVTNATSVTRIPIGNKALNLTSTGLRSADGADSLLQSTTSRRLKKYKFAAEFFKAKVAFKTGFNLDIDDIVLVDFSALKIADQYTGTRSGSARLFEIQNKSIDIKTGDVELELMDTNQDLSSRYCLMSPSSFVQNGISTTQFVIRASFNTSKFGINEFRKWESWIGCGLKIHSVDFVTSSTTVLQSINGNTITVNPPLSFVPSTGMIMEMDLYDSQTESVKAVYGSMNDNATFSDGKPQYQMI